MEVKYRNQYQDLRLAVKTLPWTDRAIARGVDYISCALLGILPGLIWLIATNQWQTIGFLTLIGATVAILITILIRRATRQTFQDWPEQTLRLEPDCLEAQSSTSWSRRRWDLVQQVFVDRRGVVIGIDKWLWHVIPRSAFATDAEMQSYGTLATQYWDKARETRRPSDEPWIPNWFELPPALFEIHYEATRKDLERVFQQGGQPLANSDKPSAPAPKSGSCSRSIVYLWIGIAAMLLVNSLITSWRTGDESPFSVIFILWCVVVCTVGFIVLSRIRSRVAAGRLTLAAETLTLTIAGCLLRSPGRISFLNWLDTLAVLQNADTIFFRLRGNQFHIIPKRSFASADDVHQFFQQCSEFWSAARSDPASPHAVPAVVIETGNPYQAPRGV